MAPIHEGGSASIRAFSLTGLSGTVLKNMDTSLRYQSVPVRLDGDFQPFEHAWSLDLPAPAALEEIAPDGCCELIFHHLDPPSEIRPDGEAAQPAALLYGPLTRVLRLRPRGPMRMTALRFSPWGVGALAADPWRLRNRATAAETVLGPETAQALAALAARADLAGFAAAASARLAARMTVPPALLAAQAVGRDFEVRPEAGIADLAAGANCSPRTLARRLARGCGLTPGEFLRLQRFQRAWMAVKAGAKAGEGGLAGIALESGYADQAHMTREFRRLAGRTPTQARTEAGFDPLYED